MIERLLVNLHNRHEVLGRLALAIFIASCFVLPTFTGLAIVRACGADHGFFGHFLILGLLEATSVGITTDRTAR